MAVKAMRIQRLTKDAKENLLEDLLKRSPNNYGQYEQGVQEILAHVKEEKDQAVFAYTKKFDHADITADNIKVTEEEIEEAYKEVDPKLVEIIRKALLNIRTYHEKQRQYSWFDSKPDGTILGQKVTPLHRVGVYVPGGKAVYPSSVLMNIVPAKVAGVDEIVMVTPPGKDGKVTPNTLVAAHEAGADVIYKVGGAQAIAALAYGTESIPKVDKIVGPGNIYVALAKKAVYGYVSIDAIAGPSEILVIADETANPRFVAADLLSQAEHDELASAILVTTSEELARKVSDVYLSRIPEDMIPYWDFNAPELSSGEPKDASAAAITASALLELSTYINNSDSASFYRNKAVEMLQILSSPAYQARNKKDAFLLHSVGHMNKGWEVDASISYADYYYLEALVRLKRLKEKQSVLANL